MTKYETFLLTYDVQAAFSNVGVDCGERKLHTFATNVAQRRFLVDEFYLKFSKGTMYLVCGATHKAVMNGIGLPEDIFNNVRYTYKEYSKFLHKK